MIEMKNKHLFLMILYMINLLIFQLNCQNCQENDNDEESCVIDNNDNYNCKYYNGKCITCSNLSSKPYFKIIQDNEESRPTCLTMKEKNNDNDILIFGKNEVVNVCEAGAIQIEDICYTSNELTQLGTTGDNHICPDYYFIKEKDGFSYFQCINNCPSGYNYYYKLERGNKKCIQSCDKFMKKISSEDNTIYRCSETCEFPDEKQYIVESSSPPKKYCLDNCPNEDKYYYEGEGEDKYKCLKNCGNDFFDGTKCITTCDSKVVQVNLNKKIYTCLSVEDPPCPLDYPYIYEKGEGENKIKYCLKSCNDTQNEYFGDSPETTYLYNNDNEKICTSQNPGDPGDLFIDKDALKWVSDCKTSVTGPYINGEMCVSSCENKVKFDTLECISNCNEDGYYSYYVKDSNICYNSCPENIGKGYQNEVDNKECQSCNYPKNIDNINAGEEGFYSDNKICKSSCDEDYYHYKDDNYCFQKECKETNRFKYRGSDLKTCIESCEEIKSLGYIYEKDFICYKEKPTVEDNQFFYKSSSGIYKFTTKDEDCLNEGYLYLKDSECVKDCNSNLYRILPTKTKLGKCFSSSEDVIPDGCNFYNKTKICSDSCAFYEIKDNDYITESKENCVEECPESLYEKGNECQNNCDQTGYFIIEENKKKNV